MTLTPYPLGKIITHIEWKQLTSLWGCIWQCHRLHLASNSVWYGLLAFSVKIDLEKARKRHDRPCHGAQTTWCTLGGHGLAPQAAQVVLGVQLLHFGMLMCTKQQHFLWCEFKQFQTYNHQNPPIFLNNHKNPIYHVKGTWMKVHPGFSNLKKKSQPKRVTDYFHIWKCTQKVHF